MRKTFTYECVTKSRYNAGDSQSDRVTRITPANRRREEYESGLCDL